MNASAPGTENNHAAFPLRCGTAEELADARRLLTQAPYTALDICRRLGIETIYDFRPLREGRQVGREISDRLDLLIRLFLDAEAVDLEIARALLPADGLERFQDLGLLRPLALNQGRCGATVLLYPTESLYIASDQNCDPDAAAPVARPADVVYPAITKNTRRFLSILPISPCDSLLELCAGTGIAALVGAQHARHSWAADITERATCFARFNAMLNGLENVTAVQGDLYEAVPGQTFDRIVAHPPYMPAAEQRYFFRDGGEDGEQITRRILAGLPARLRPGGRLYCTCLGIDRTDAPFERRVREMLGEHAEEFDVLVVAIQSLRPSEYCWDVATTPAAGPGEIGRRHEVLRRLSVERLVYCALVVQRASGTRPTFTVRRQAGPATAARELEWLMRWETAAAYEDPVPALLDARPVASAETELHLTHRQHEGEWVPADCTVRTTTPFLLEARCPPWGAALIARCDGMSSVREHCRFLKENGAIPPETPEEEFAEFVRAFVAGGILDVRSTDSGR